MISIIITSYKEPHTVGRAIEAIINQNIKEKYELICASPDEETAKVVKTYSKLDSRIKYFKDPGKGKMLALNLLFKKIKSDIIILTDGDVYLSNNSVSEIIKAFSNKSVGCVAGRPVSIDNKKQLLGYWSHLLTHGAHLARLKRHKNSQYFTCSGYLFGFRNGLIKEFPRSVPEDAVIPYIVLKKGYKLSYAQEAKVFVSYPKNIIDWIKQKKRINKAYHNIYSMIIEGDKIPKMKSMRNEIIEGTIIALSYPKNIREFFYTLALFPFRLFVWSQSFFDHYIISKKHTDAWDQIKSTKT
ncbi:glycosyltransferase [Candidatus Woesearchaeota archaeon]|nr:glycosyltransferase [Candidatus Woesearchaeota archaeon]